MHSEKLWNRHFIFISMSNFFQFITFQALIATLPLFVVEHLRGKENQIGYIMAAFMVGSIVVRPVAGKWLNKVGKKNMLTYALLLFLGASFAYFFAHNFYVLLFVRVIHGISFGVASTAAATLAIDYIPVKRRGEGMGYFSASVSLAMVIGPFLGLLFIHYYSFTVLFILCCVFSFISLISSLMIKDSSSKQSLLSFKKEASGMESFIEVKAIPIAVSACMLSFVFSGVNSFISVYSTEIGIGSMASYFFMTYAIVVFVSRPITGKLFDKFGGNPIIYYGSAFFFIGILCLSQATNSFLLLVSSVFIGLGFGSITPSLQTLAIVSTSMERVGLATATYFCFFDFGMGLGSVVLGLVATHTSFSSMYIFSSFFILISVLFYFFWQKKFS